MSESQKDESPVLENVRSRASFEVLCKLIDEQKGNTTMPREIAEIFETKDAAFLTEKLMSQNTVVSALARSRLFYHGSSLQNGGSSVEVSVIPAAEAGNLASPG